MPFRLTRKTLVLASAVLATTACFATCAYATAIPVSDGASVKNIKAGHTYKNCDVTGDGVRDTLKVTLESDTADSTGSSYIGFDIAVNGRQVFYTDSCGYKNSFVCKLIRMEDGMPYFYVATPSDNDFTDTNALLYYNSKSKMLGYAVDCTDLFGGSYANQVSAGVASVSGNTVKVTYSPQFYSIGLSTFTVAYTNSESALKRSSNVFKMKVAYSDSSTKTTYDHSFAARKSMKVYKSKATKAVAFKIAAGKEVYFKKLAISNGVPLARVQVGSKFGWVKMAKTSSSSLLYKNKAGLRISPFKGTVFAG